jgi:hypothetical protein
MFYAIKWHYDQAKKGREVRSLLLTSAKVASAFVLSALGLVFVTFALMRWLGMDLTMP